MKLIPITTAFALLFLPVSVTVRAQQSHPSRQEAPKNTAKIQYGTASFYANKFNGRKTANGEVFSQDKLTAAHNSLPFGTWIKVTNLKNKKSVVVRVNDRLAHDNKRLVDLSRAGASKLGYTSRGLTKVKIEVLGNKKPETVNSTANK